MAALPLEDWLLLLSSCAPASSSAARPACTPTAFSGYRSCAIATSRSGTTAATAAAPRPLFAGQWLLLICCWLLLLFCGMQGNLKGCCGFNHFGSHACSATAVCSCCCTSIWQYVTSHAAACGRLINASNCTGYAAQLCNEVILHSGLLEALADG